LRLEISELVGADIAGGSLRPGDAALVGGGADAVVARIDGRRAGEQGVGLRGAAVVGQADGYENEDELTAEIEAEVEPEIGMEIEADSSQPGDSEGYASEPDDSESEPGPEPATAGESSSKKRSRRRRRRR
jgi:hypothetical protein